MEKVDLLGIRADGSSAVIGQVPMPPKMKMREIVENFIGRPSDDPDDDSPENTCMWALEAFHAWMLEQGWTPPQITITPKPQEK